MLPNDNIRGEPPSSGVSKVSGAPLSSPLPPSLKGFPVNYSNHKTSHIYYMNVAHVNDNIRGEPPSSGVSNDRVSY